MMHKVTMLGTGLSKENHSSLNLGRIEKIG